MVYYLCSVCFLLFLYIFDLIEFQFCSQYEIEEMNQIHLKTAKKFDEKKLK